MPKPKAKPRPATLTQVATQAGVSIKTVSRVVNGEAAVHTKTRKRVLEAIQALHYRPNAAARSLASARSYFVALVYDNPSENYLLQMQSGALEVCRDRGYSLLLQPSNYKSPKLADELTALVTERGRPGLILTPPICDNPKVTQRLDTLGVKYVRVVPTDRRQHSPYVWVDDRRAAYELTRYLLSIGHQRIAFIKGHPDHGATRPRFEGFRQALREQRLTPDKNLIAQGFFSFESGEQSARKLLAHSHRPTAIFASNDEMAAGVLHVAHQLGLEMPRQLSVAGFDDTTLSRHTWPSLTTVRQPLTAMAKSAVLTLIRQMRDDPSREENASTVFPYELIIRGSTSALAR